MILLFALFLSSFDCALCAFHLALYSSAGSISQSDLQLAVADLLAPLAAPKTISPSSVHLAVEPSPSQPALLHVHISLSNVSSVVAATFHVSLSASLYTGHWDAKLALYSVGGTVTTDVALVSSTIQGTLDTGGVVTVVVQPLSFSGANVSASQLTVLFAFVQTSTVSGSVDARCSSIVAFADSQTAVATSYSPTTFQIRSASAQTGVSSIPPGIPISVILCWRVGADGILTHLDTLRVGVRPDGGGEQLFSPAAVVGVSISISVLVLLMLLFIPCVVYLLYRECSPQNHFDSCDNGYGGWRHGTAHSSSQSTEKLCCGSAGCCRRDVFCCCPPSSVQEVYSGSADAASIFVPPKVPRALLCGRRVYLFVVSLLSCKKQTSINAGESSRLRRDASEVSMRDEAARTLPAQSLSASSFGVGLKQEEGSELNSSFARSPQPSSTRMTRKQMKALRAKPVIAAGSGQRIVNTELEAMSAARKARLRGFNETEDSAQREEVLEPSNTKRPPPLTVTTGASSLRIAPGSRTNEDGSISHDLEVEHELVISTPDASKQRIWKPSIGKASPSAGAKSPPLPSSPSPPQNASSVPTPAPPAGSVLLIIPLALELKTTLPPDVMQWIAVGVDSSGLRLTAPCTSVNGSTLLWDQALPLDRLAVAMRVNMALPAVQVKFTLISSTAGGKAEGKAVLQLHLNDLVDRPMSVELLSRRADGSWSAIGVFHVKAAVHPTVNSVPIITSQEERLRSVPPTVLRLIAPSAPPARPGENAMSILSP